MDEVSGEQIAGLVLQEFESWPQKRKPLSRGEGTREWVPLAGVVAQGRDGLKCLVATTGMKCLPHSKVPLARGVTLHDWHAEVLAIRSLNRFLLEECHALAVSKKQLSEYVRLRTPSEITESQFQPFALNDDIRFHMYCSEAPCGDASMELTMAAQEDATPWELPPTSSSSDPSATSLEYSTPTVLHGRTYFSHLGLVRLKPSRPDAPPTLSKSCSDKLTLIQSTSFLSSLTSLLISPSDAYLSTLTLPSSQANPISLTRCFETRLQSLNTLSLKNQENGYYFHPLKIMSYDEENLPFAYSRRQALPTPTTKLLPTNISTISLRLVSPSQQQTLIGGTLQGRVQFSPKGSPLVSKHSLWTLCLDIAAQVKSSHIEAALRKESYKEVKDGDLLAGCRKVKQDTRDVLGGWVKNTGGEDFGLELGESEMEKKSKGKSEK